MGAQGSPGGRPLCSLWPDSALWATLCFLCPLFGSWTWGRGLFLSQNFHESIVAVSGELTSCTLTLYKNIIQDLPPTPSKFHYIFNLRDLSRVFNGLVLTDPQRWVVLLPRGTL